MRHTNHKNGRDKTAATIVLCFCLITLTSIFTIKASIDKVNESAKNLPVTQNIATEKEPEESQEKEPSEEQVAPTSSTVPIVDSAPQEDENPKFLPPMSVESASLSKKYSMDMVIYNKTLDQYMTHPGIDLEAPSGSGVYAIADGTVIAVYEDDAYGTSIEIRHDGNFVSKYASLESSTFIEEGDIVSQGQQIGTIGRTALYEALEASHLHFELYKDDNLCNPKDYISFS